MARATHLALLRGINVGGHNMVPMADLRSLCAADLGWGGVATYIQSGNLIFEAEGERSALESGLERAIERRFGLTIAVMVRSAAEWPAYVAGNPFPGATEREPKTVMLGLCKEPPKPGAVEELRGRAADGERIEQAGDAIWIHFPNGSARSKLSPSFTDRAVGSPVTTRNWRTVLKLDELVSGRR